MEKFIFDENWKILYEEWRKGMLTSEEFRKKCNMEEEEFYELLTKYQNILKNQYLVEDFVSLFK